VTKVIYSVIASWRWVIISSKAFVYVFIVYSVFIGANIVRKLVASILSICSPSRKDTLPAIVSKSIIITIAFRGTGSKLEVL
jgi:hypothetical protein